jgi:hypothetical protein
MACLILPATTATTPQPPRNRNQKPWLRTPLCNHRATIAPATSATMLQPRCNKAQPSRNHPIFDPRNRATIPYRGGKMVAPSRAHSRLPAPAPAALRPYRASLAGPSLTPQGRQFTRIADTHRQAISSRHGQHSEGEGGKRQPYTSSFPFSVDTRNHGIAVQSCSAFGRSGRTKTATRAHTHQRTRQGLCQSGLNSREGTPLLLTLQRIPLKALSFALGRNKVSSKTTVKSHGGRPFGRVSNHVFHSVEAVDAPARHQASNRPRNLIDILPAKPELLAIPVWFAAKTGRVGWGRAAFWRSPDKSTCPIPTPRRIGNVEVDCGGNRFCRAERCAKTQPWCCSRVDVGIPTSGLQCAKRISDHF